DSLVAVYRLSQDRTVRNRIKSPDIIAALISPTEYWCRSLKCILNGSVAGTSSMCPPIAERNETRAGEIQKRDSPAAAVITTMRRSCKNLTRLLECVTLEVAALMRINKGPMISPSTSTLAMVLVTSTPADSRVGRTANALGATAKL